MPCRNTFGPLSVSDDDDSVPMSEDAFGQLLYPRLALVVDVAQAWKITGMLLRLPVETTRYLIIDENALQGQINDAMQVLQLFGVDGREAAAAGANPAAGGCARC